MSGHTRRAHFSCEDRDYCEDDCLDGHVCDECTDAQDEAVWWPCPLAESVRGTTDFLLARIAEDEEIARQAPGPDWHVAVERTGRPGRWNGIGAYLITLDPPDRLDSLSVGEEVARSNGNIPWTVDHIARHDPARVLADCTARRRLVELHTHKMIVGWWWDECPALSHDDKANETCATLRLLAAPFASHPDFDASWGGSGG